MAISVSRTRTSAGICLAIGIAAFFATRLGWSHEGSVPTRVGRTVEDTVLHAEIARERASTDPLRLVRDGESIAAFAPGVHRTHAGVAVYLHGISGRATNGCPRFRAGTAGHAWLVCPRGSVHLDGGTSSWGGTVTERASVVFRAEEAAVAAGADAAGPRVLIGFSQGAMIALDHATRHPGRYDALVLVAGQIEPEATSLRAAGIRKVVLAAGALDMTYRDLERSTARLVHDGFDARFVSLGRVGHTYVAEDAAVLDDAIAWSFGGPTDAVMHAHDG